MARPFSKTRVRSTRRVVLAVVFIAAPLVGIACRAQRAARSGEAGASASATAVASGTTSAGPATLAALPGKIDLVTKADELAHRFIILDGHIDVPWRLEESRDEKGNVTEDISLATPKGDFDWERAKKGGLDAPFMSIYVPAKYEDHGAKKTADKLIDMVLGFAQKSPDKFAVARTPADVRANFTAGKMSLCMGMENGSPIEHDIANVKYFFDRGIRYITLAHSKDNHLADSSFDKGHKNKGLSPFGREVVAEMNRLGVMIDVSHLSDDAFWHVMQTSKAPVIASHSSCRHFTPGWERNMSDEMIKALGERGGVVQINFGSGFVDAESQKQGSRDFDELEGLLKKQGLDFGSPKAKAIIEEFRAKHPRKRATVEQVADHVDRVKRLAGVEHVGFGSDFDGVGDTLPTGLKDVSQYPNLIRVLLERGYTDEEIEKICSGNVLRVWQAVNDFARR